MDELADLHPLQVGRRLRYRVAVTIIDQEASQATCEIYDTDCLERLLGPKTEHPQSGRVVQDVSLRLLDAHDLTSRA